MMTFGPLSFQVVYRLKRDLFYTKLQRTSDLHTIPRVRLARTGARSCTLDLNLRINKKLKLEISRRMLTKFVINSKNLGLQLYLWVHRAPGAKDT